MRAIIVEDEPIAARRLARMLESRDMEIIKVIPSVKLLKEHLKGEEVPELYFCDIHLNDGIVFEAISGIDLQAPIIFTTAYDQYAIKAFKQNSIDYLLKPIGDEELDAAIDKYKKTTKQQFDLSSISNLLGQLGTTPAKEYRQRISIRVADKIKRFDMEEVLFFYSENKMNFLFTKVGRSFPIDQSIEAISAELDPKVFYRVNRGYIVAEKAMNEIIAYSNSRLKIKIDKAPNHEIIVSRDRVKEFKTWLGG